MQRLSLVLMLLLAVSGCSHSKPWSAQTLPACGAGTGVAELDRERSYLASLLALDVRRYAILHTTPGRDIEATYSADYPPSQPVTHWVVSVLDDARVILDVPSTKSAVSERDAQRAERLVFSITQNQCRELDWLRWEAQNRGLVAVGATGPVAPPTSGGGGERAPAAVAMPTTANAAQIAALRQERAKIRIAPPAAGAAVGLGFVIVGASMLTTGLIYVVGGCSDTVDEPDCSVRDGGRIIAPIGGGVLGGGLIALSIALPIMLKRLRKAREIGRQIKALQTLQLGPRAERGRVGIVLGGAF